MLAVAALVLVAEEPRTHTNVNSANHDRRNTNLIILTCRIRVAIPTGGITIIIFLPPMIGFKYPPPPCD